MPINSISTVKIPYTNVDINLFEMNKDISKTINENTLNEKIY